MSSTFFNEFGQLPDGFSVYRKETPDGDSKYELFNMLEYFNWIKQIMNKGWHQNCQGTNCISEINVDEVG